MIKKYVSTAIFILVSVLCFAGSAKTHSKKAGSGVPDSVYIQRLKALPFEFKMTYNSLVRKSIEFYTVQYRRKLQQVVGLSKIYFPVIDSIFNVYQIPTELKYVSIIESSLNPLAVSPYHAAGLWQFVSGTGKMYGLKINKYVDERHSLIESTRAAAKYFKNLFNIYNDWQVVLAAYNCGSGIVSRAIKHSGRHDFQGISGYLPERTREYIPDFIGVAYAFNYYQEHNITPIEPPSPLQKETVELTSYTSLSKVAKMLYVPLNTLRLMNPQYISNIIPASRSNPLTLNVPLGKADKFTEVSGSVYDLSASVDDDKPQEDSKLHKITHQVKSGETISKIAVHYHVSVNSLRTWNHLKSNNLKRGQHIVVYRN